MFRGVVVEQEQSVLVVYDRVDDHIKELVLDDPVRPEISVNFRCRSPDNLVFVLREAESAVAVLCCAFRSSVPSSVEELLKPEGVGACAAIFYSVWSYRKGSGRKIIPCAQQWIKSNFLNISEFYTLSPPGSGVRDFHLGLGALLWRTNSSTVNYKY